MSETERRRATSVVQALVNVNGQSAITGSFGPSTDNVGPAASGSAAVVGIVDGHNAKSPSVTAVLRASQGRRITLRVRSHARPMRP